MSLFRKLQEAWKRVWAKIKDIIYEPDEPEKPEPEPDPDPDPSPPEENWRDGYSIGTISARNGVVEFWTRNIREPQRPQPGRGDYEYIIALVHGEGINRLLVMTMYARRPRISLDWVGAGHRFRDGLFSQPLPGPSHWKVASDRSRIWIELDGRKIWEETGRYFVTSATMGGYRGRGFLGEWRA